MRRAVVGLYVARCLCVCSFGAQHDGYGNDCDSMNQHVMSTAPQRLTNATFTNPFSFSACSVHYFREYLASLTEYVAYTGWAKKAESQTHDHNSAKS